MKTRVLKINVQGPEKEKIKKAADFIIQGKLVAFPTETVYGLGANAFDEKAVMRIFEVKGRPADNPLIVHISNKHDVYKLAKKIPEKAVILMNRFWPGPLTLVMKKNKDVLDIVTAGLDSVAVRMPKNKIALELINTAGTPIAAPSANISGKPSTTSVKHVIDDLDGKIEMIIDGGDTEIGVESTVVDMTGEKPVLLRPGAITIEMLRNAIGDVVYEHDTKYDKKPKSPGMKHKHYKPNAEVILVIGNNKVKLNEKIKEIRRECENNGRMVEMIRKENYSKLAKNLFNMMREFDKRRIDAIIIEGINEEDLGLAIMNRLKKAADKIINL